MSTVVGPLVSTPLISDVQPFSYKDGETYLGKLGRLEKYIRDTLEYLVRVQREHDSFTDEKLEKLRIEVNQIFADLVAEIASVSDGALAFNPTNGKKEPLSKVVGDTYDNNRIYAYFAAELDALDMTAAEYDEWLAAKNARHFDLAMTYPVLHDCLNPALNA